MLTRDIAKGPSPGSKAKPGVGEQSSPVAPRTPPVFMRRTGLKEPIQLPTKGSDHSWTFRAQGPTVNLACWPRRSLLKGNAKNKIT